MRFGFILTTAPAFDSSFNAILGVLAPLSDLLNFGWISIQSLTVTSTHEVRGRLMGWAPRSAFHGGAALEHARPT